MMNTESEIKLEKSFNNNLCAGIVGRLLNKMIIAELAKGGITEAKAIELLCTPQAQVAFHAIAKQMDWTGTLEVMARQIAVAFIEAIN